MRLMTILGTRPEIIRLSRVIPLLDGQCEHILVHTGQNYDERLNDLFFDELKVRKPDVCLGIKGTSAADQVGKIIHQCDEAMEKAKPDRLLILGDTNSGLSAIMAKRRGIRVFHMEAGNRCFDDRVPEEVNRRVIDHSSDVLMPYTERSRDNLMTEGIPSRRIYVTGNPIFEVINHYRELTTQSPVLSRLNLKYRGYILLTAHRAENVDDPSRLKNILEGASMVGHEYKIKVICSLHPRTRNKMKTFGIHEPENIVFCEPFGFFDFIRLEEYAYCVLTDSGTVQEECCLLKVPNVTIRDTTERPETIEAGSNILCGTKAEDIINAVRLASNRVSNWQAPAEYLRSNVAEIVAKIVLSHYEER
jgi:UDP-N-acetylglucosamine 2-epimerase (non-hydrolysing)